MSTILNADRLKTMRAIRALALSIIVLPMSALAQDASTDDSTERPVTEVTYDPGASGTEDSTGELSATAEGQAKNIDTDAAVTPDPTDSAVAASESDQVVADSTATGEESSADGPKPEAATAVDSIAVSESEPSKATEETQEYQDAPQIDEVMVTAQKRSQAAQEVPISISVLSETFIKEQGITTVADALLFVPNFKVTEIAGRVSPQCRGFTVSEGNAAFEAPCGIALDGVAFSRGAYFSAGLLDLKRIEVLRGPQGTTFGKNTTAGVVALYSKDPTDVFTANADLQYGASGPGVRRAELGFGGPLIPGVVNFRVAGLRELRDGFMENTYHQTDPSVSEDVGNSERSGYRAKLTFPNILGAELKLLHERTDLFSNGLAIKVIPDTQAFAAYIRQYDPNADFGENYKTSNRGNQLWVETTRTQADLDFDWAGWSFTAVGGFGELASRQDLMAFPTPIPLAGSLRTERSPFTTAELRAVSPDLEGLLGLDSLFGIDLGSSSVLIGLFGQEQELNLTSDAEVFYEGVVLLLLAQQNVSLPLGTVFNLVGQQFGVNLSESIFTRFKQTAKSQAIFSQLTWDMSDKWSVDFAGRLSEDAKDAHYDLSYSTPAVLTNTTGDRGYVKDKSLDSSSFQPKVSVTYRLNDDINLFAHWARAFKSGGFNTHTPTGDPERPNATNPGATTGSLSYDDESGTDYGFDVKMRLFDKRMQLNLSLFRLDVSDFQVLTEVLGSETTPGGPRLPNGYQQVVNAGEARAQGVELDLTWLATNWLTVIAATGYNDTEYLSFPLDNCGPHETPDPETAKCDHTGFPFLSTPKLSGTLSLDTRFPLGGLWSALGDTSFLLGGTIEYTGSQFSSNYAPNSEQDGYFRYRAHTGLSNASQGWSFRITALNLTDEYFGSKVTDPSVGLTTVQPIPPRSIFAQFSWKY